MKASPTSVVLLVLGALLLSGCGGGEPQIDTRVRLETGGSGQDLDPTVLEPDRLAKTIADHELATKLVVRFTVHDPGMKGVVYLHVFQLGASGDEWVLAHTSPDASASPVLSQPKSAMNRDRFFRVAAEKICAIVDAEREKLSKAKP
ncbi:MAG: hypothetical protein H6839_07295 [Planctomycetes bacterium]|nr:hypothetical protein [Planctomycetota bacterium]